MKELRQQQQQKKRRQRRYMVLIGAALVIIVVVVLVSALTTSPAKKTATSTSTTPSSTTATTAAPAPPVSVKLVDAPAKVGCPNLDGSSPHYTHFSSAPPMCIDPSKTYTAKIVTDIGTITVKLATGAQDAKTVNNFVFLSLYHFYNGTAFHRVIPGFMDQGGDPTGTGTGGPGYAFDGGAPSSWNVYKTGAVAMANSTGPSSDGSQFFIMVPGGQKDITPPADEHVQPSYSYVGQVTSGLSVVEKINSDGTAAGTPKVVHKILNVTVTES